MWSNNPLKIRKANPTIVKKGWGHEKIIANFNFNSWEPEDKGYCLKLLVFDGKNEGSMHFHSKKHETFYVLEGNFKIQYINTQNADEKEITLFRGESLVIPPNNPHRIICLDKGIIIEGSSPDYPEDSFRVAKGDSQKATV